MGFVKAVLIFFLLAVIFAQSSRADCNDSACKKHYKNYGSQSCDSLCAQLSPELCDGPEPLCKDLGYDDLCQRCRDFTTTRLAAKSNAPTEKLAQAKEVHWVLRPKEHRVSQC